MNELPNELLVIILKKLNYEDLFKNSKFVCRKWHYLIERHIRFEELVVIKVRTIFNNHWYPSYRPINLDYSIICKDLHFLQSSSFKKYFITIRRFKIEFPIDENFDYLNEFPNLTHLELNKIALRQDILLNLPWLKVLYVESFTKSQNDFKLFVDAKLDVLFVESLSRIKLSHPNSIKFLEVKHFDDLNEFKELDTFKFKNLIDPNDSEIVSRMPDSLKQLHLYSKIPCDSNKMQTFLTYILNQRESLGKLNLEIYFNGIQLSSDHQLNDFVFYSEEIELHRKNYRLLNKTLPYYTKLDYNKLMSIYNDKIPDQFHEKYLNILEINVRNRVRNENAFVEFLKSCKNLSCLVLDRPMLSQSGFYDKLPSITSLLNRFVLNSEDIELDYEFILKFKVLVSFRTVQHLPPDLVFMAEKLKFLRKISFKTNKTDVEILKQNSYKYDLQIGEEIYNEIDLDQLYQKLVDFELR